MLLVGPLVLLAPSIAAAAPEADQTQSVTSEGDSGSACSSMGFSGSSGSLFTAGVSGKLTSIVVPLLRTTDSDALLVKVFNTVNDVPSGGAIAEQSVATSALTPLRDGGTLTVAFDNPATVTAETAYAFVLVFPTCATSAQLAFDIGSAPPDKRLVQTQDMTNWNVDSSFGFSFTTFVDAFTSQGDDAADESTPATPATLAQTGTGAIVVTVIWSSIAIAGGTLILMATRAANNIRVKRVSSE